MRAIATASAVSILLLAAARADEGQVQLGEGPGKEAVVASCATCHSLDYIPMNSPFLDAKGWEASVNKMIKVMGAPISPEDAAQIREYLTAHYGKGASPPAGAAAPAGATAVPASTPGEPPRTPELLEKGRASYARYCASCHGPGGAGDGPAAKALRPPPRDLTGVKGGAAGVFAVLNTGVKGTAMVPFKHLSESDRWAIAHYVDSLKTGK
ncbi:MAG TPA: c-type cytochrome [Anaeromyxobacter sp.]|nr:c-type cytochrome [Anaeromyxobacter sp.]